MDRSIIVKYMAMLRAFPEHEPIMLRLDSFVRKTNTYLSTNHLPSQGQLEKLLTRELDHAVGTLMNSSCFIDSTARSSNVNKRKTKMQLSQVIESYLLEGIHARVFSRLSNEHLEKGNLNHETNSSADIFRLPRNSSADIFIFFVIFANNCLFFFCTQICN